MAVEARHLDLFPSHLLCNSREMFNPLVDAGSNLYRDPATTQGAGVATPSESAVPLYGAQIGGTVLRRLAKTMNNPLCNPPLNDDSGVTFNNNVGLSLPRKRPREAAVVVNNAATSSNNNGGLISAPNVVSGRVLGRCGAVSGGAGSFSFLGEDFSSQIMQQQLEVDHLITLHAEKARLEIEDLRRKQLRRIVGVIEDAFSKKLIEKEEQVAKIAKLNFALEERVKSIYLENQLWRDLALTNEATANALRSNLEQVLSQADCIRSGDGAGTVPDVTEDAVSCCGSTGEDDSDEILRRTEVAGEDEDRRRMCRMCGACESIVLVLPCRHLCLCARCGPSMDTCPVCNSAKNASVHVNLS